MILYLFKTLLARRVVGQVTSRRYEHEIIPNGSEFTLYEITQADGAVARAALQGHKTSPAFGEHIEAEIARFNGLNLLPTGTFQIRSLDELPSIRYQMINNYRIL